MEDWRWRVSTMEGLREADQTVARLGRGASRLRLRIGEGLDRMAERGWAFNLGFSSLEGYALERCERESRWCRDSRGLARRLRCKGYRGLPAIRAAVLAGRMEWTKAELLARYATPDDEAELVEMAMEKNVAHMKAWLTARARQDEVADGDGSSAEPERGEEGPAAKGEVHSAREGERVDESSAGEESGVSSVGDTAGVSSGGEAACASPGTRASEDPDRQRSDQADAAQLLEGLRAAVASVKDRAEHVRSIEDIVEEEDEEPRKTLEIRVGQEEIYLLELSRILMEFVDARRPSDEKLIFHLLGEGLGSLPGLDPAKWSEIAGRHLDDEAIDAGIERIRAQRKAREQAAAERRQRPDPVPDDLYEEFEPLPTEKLALDADIRKHAKELATRDLEIGRLARAIFQCNGWKRLEYGSPQQYAEERVGISLRGLRERMALARDVEDYPEIGEAIEAGQLGMEAARLVARVATADTVEAWIERAKVRTLVHLREEVEAIELRAKFRDDASMDPPEQADLEEVAEIHRAIQSGEAVTDIVEELKRLDRTGVQITVNDGADRDLRLRIPAWLRDFFEQTRAAYAEVAGTHERFIEFLVLSHFVAWQKWFEDGETKQNRYTRVYLRDLYRCRSPVCDCRDIGPHHIQPRGRGGSDEDENVAGECFVCHIPGIHGGLIQVTGTATHLRYQSLLMVVDGRDRRLLNTHES